MYESLDNEATSKLLLFRDASNITCSCLEDGLTGRRRLTLNEVCREDLALILTKEVKDCENGIDRRKIL